MNKTTLWVCRTAVMTALLLIAQYSTASLGQYATGSCVNFVLAMSVFIGGFACGLVVAIVSPFFAFFFGIGPAFIILTPCIALGNTAFVLFLSLTWAKFVNDNAKIRMAMLCVLAGAFCKFLGLYITVVKLALPALGLPDAKLALMSSMFSIPQFITAFIGGSLATIVASAMIKANIKKIL